MSLVKKIEDPENLRFLINNFKKSKSLSGYQIFNLEKKPQFTRSFVLKNKGFNESMIIYDEIRPSSVIVRACSYESLDSFLKSLSIISDEQFLLFIEGFNERDAVRNLVTKRFGYHFSCDEDVLKLDRGSKILTNQIAIQSSDSKVEVATEKDLQDVLAVYDEFNERAYTEVQYLEQIKEGFIYVLRVDGKLAGTASLHTMYPSVSIMGGFRISKSFQKAGLGRFLLFNVSRRILRYSQQVLSYTPSENSPMILLRRSVGYFPISKRIAFAIDSKLRPVNSHSSSLK